MASVHRYGWEKKVPLVLEVECEVSSQVEYSLQAIWGVSIRELHLALWKPWSTLRDASLNGTLLQGHAQYLTPPQTYPLKSRIDEKLVFTSKELRQKKKRREIWISNNRMLVDRFREERETWVTPKSDRCRRRSVKLVKNSVIPERLRIAVCAVSCLPRGAHVPPRAIPRNVAAVIFRS